MTKTSRRNLFGVKDDVAESEFVFEDDHLSTSCPKLYDLLARRCHEGKSCKPCTLSFFGQEGLLTGCLNWDEEQLILFVPIRGSEDAFEQLEAHLGVDKPNWRKKKGSYVQRNGR